MKQHFTVAIENHINIRVYHELHLTTFRHNMAILQALCFLLVVSCFPDSVDGQGSPELIILMTERHSASTRGVIYKLTAHHNNFTILPLNVITPAAIDYDKVNKRVYWTDVSKEEVKSCDLDGGNDIVVAMLNNISYPEGLTIDSDAGRIFYTDRGNQVIVRIEVDGFRNTTIVSTGLRRPWGIVADTTKKLLYWVDYVKNQIESCDYDGNNRKVITSTGDAPTGIAINERTGRLYWCELRGQIKSIRTNGTGRKTLFPTTNLDFSTHRFWDISLFNGFLYSAEETRSEIAVIPEDGGYRMYLGSRYFENVNGIHVFSPNSFETGCPDGKYGVGCSAVCGRCTGNHPCEKTVGVCLGGCEPGYKRGMCIDVCNAGTYGQNCSSVCGSCKIGSTCHHETGQCSNGCQPGWTGLRCEQKGMPQLVALVAKRHKTKNGIQFDGDVIKLDLHELEVSSSLGIRNHVTPTAIDYNDVDKRIYWTDISTEKVRRCDLDGRNDEVVASLNKAAEPRGLSIDGTARKLFFTDSGNDVIETIDLTTFTRTVIVNTDLFHPAGITVDRVHKKLYWVDFDSNKIETSDYMGNGRRVVTSENVFHPRGIALNEKTGRLYWCEYYGKLKSILTNGTNMKERFTRTSKRFMDVSLFNGLLYVADFSDGAILVISESENEKYFVTWTRSRFENITGIHVFSPNSEETGCQDGRYGVGCLQTCGRCSSLCEKTTGGCFGLCEAGYSGNTCSEECSPGTFTRQAECLPCHCKSGEICNSGTGECPNGCSAGWRGSNCQSECGYGRYGEDCARECGYCQSTSKCDKVTGACPNGCRFGWTGETCEDRKDFSVSSAERKAYVGPLPLSFVSVMLLMIPL